LERPSAFEGIKQILCRNLVGIFQHSTSGGIFRRRHDIGRREAFGDIRHPLPSHASERETDQTAFERLPDRGAVGHHIWQHEIEAAQYSSVENSW